LLIILEEQKALSETERQECCAESTQLAQQLHSSGQYLAANPLHPTSMATSVRVRDGKRFAIPGFARIDGSAEESARSSPLVARCLFWAPPNDYGA
jgi:hypothetical protein